MRFRIRSKLAAALVVPLVALVAGSGLLAMDARAEADRVDAEVELSLVALGPGSLTGALQDERNFVALDVLGLGDAAAVSVGSLEQAVAATDAAAADLEATLRAVDPAVRGAFAPALESLTGLQDVRERHRNFDGPRHVANVELADELFGSYRDVIDRFFAATATVAADLDESSLRNGVEIADALDRRGEALTVAIRHLAMDVLSGQRDPEAALAISAAAARAELMQERVEELAVGPYGVILGDDPAQQGFEQALSTVESYVAGGDVDLAELLDTEGLGASTQGDVVTGILLDEASTILGEARDQVRLYVIAAAVVVSLAILVSYFATTSITRPLRALRSEADDLARTRLPGAVRSILETPPGEDVAVPDMAPIGAATRDEVGDVAEALNEVQSSTLTLAMDQAVLRRNFADSFVNLGRRNQLLLDRQLDFITRLEQNETDPDQLDALFRLDHLATRMRRNAESLLVLAGAESPRQWGTPVSMTDLVRSGLAEVEDYQRVHVRHLDDARVAGQAVAGLAHVLAELAENALAFSPPDEQVEVKGRWSGNGDYVIAIADNGIGMTEHELEQANRRLSGRESYTVAPSRYLGHYVAGNLARQLGVSVRLQDDPAGGLVATVTLPPELMTPADVVDEPAVVADAATVEDGAPPDEGGDPGPTPPERTELTPVAVESPAAESPVTESPVTESPVLESPVPESPVTESPVPESPVPESPVPASPVSEPAVPAPLDEPELPSPGPVAGDGLPRRVPGAQRPDRSLLPGHRSPVDVPVGAASPRETTGTDEDTSGDPAATGPVGALGFLQAFRSGPGADPAGNGSASRHESPEEER